MRPYILLVEDDAHATELARRAFAQHARFDVTAVQEGRAALDFLHCRGEYAQRDGQLPALVMLDLGLPDLPGLEVLAAIKGDVHLQHLPVVILTVSQRGEDVRAAQELGANFFVTKPVKHEDFEAAVTAISNFWSTAVRTPGPRT